MIFELAGVKFNIDFFHTTESKKPYLLFIHGYTGSADDWKTVISQIDKNFSIAGIDLIGHGESDSPETEELYTADSISYQIMNIIERSIRRKVIPLGYSMGGRAALNFAANYPDKVEALILESTTPGIREENLRKERIKKDSELIEFIRTHRIEEFIDYWMNLEIFGTQKRLSDEKLKQIKTIKLRNNPTGLINSLKGFGTGRMLPLYDRIKNIKCKTLLISGELDEKYTALNREIVSLFPYAKLEVIKNAGHNTHLEVPAEFARAVNEFLKSL